MAGVLSFLVICYQFVLIRSQTVAVEIPQLDEILNEH